MATIAEMLVQSGLQSSKDVPDLPGAIAQGVQLGAQIENIQKNREMLEQQKEQIRMQKADKIMGAIEAGSKFQDKAAQNLYFKNYVPGMIKALKMDDVFSPDLMEYVKDSPDVRNKLIGLKLDMQDKINRGELRGAQIWEYAKGKLQPEELAQLDTDSLVEQQKFAASEMGKDYRSQLTQQGQFARQEKGIATAGQVEASKGTAKEFTDYQALGGKANINKQLSTLDRAYEKLASNKVKTGKLSAAIPIIGSDVAQDVLNPDIAAIRDDIRGAVQGTLRQTLGSQFTAQEGEAIFNRSFNPRLSSEENARRLKKEIDALREMAESKEAEFRAQGFEVKGKPLVGSKKEVPLKGPSDEIRSRISAKKEQFKLLKPEDQKKVLKSIVDKYDISIDEVRKMLGN